MQHHPDNLCETRYLGARHARIDVDQRRRAARVPRAARGAAAGADRAVAQAGRGDARAARAVRHLPARRRGEGLALARAVRRTTAARWHVADLSSRWGTFVNGVKLDAGPRRAAERRRPDPHHAVDVHASHRTREAPRAVQSTTTTGADDGPRRQPRRTARPLADDMLALLLESAAAIHAATDEKQLAEMVIDAAVPRHGPAQRRDAAAGRCGRGTSRSSRRDSPPLAPAPTGRRARSSAAR